jgi:hypothetical protein
MLPTIREVLLKLFGEVPLKLRSGTSASMHKHLHNIDNHRKGRVYIDRWLLSRGVLGCVQRPRPAEGAGRPAGAKAIIHPAFNESSLRLAPLQIERPNPCEER